MVDMLCPVCLAFGVQTPAQTTVNGTQYCVQHGVEAIGAMTTPRGPRSMRNTTSQVRAVFTSPVDANVQPGIVQPDTPLPPPQPPASE